MNGKDLSRHLSDLPEEMIAEAMAPAKDNRKWLSAKRILRMAAVAAVIAILISVINLLPGNDEPQDLGFLTMPGAIKVYAYDMAGGSEIENMEKYELIDGVNMTSGCLFLASSVSHGLPLTFEVDSSQFDGADILIRVDLNYGSFLIKNDEPITEENKHTRKAYLSLGREFTIQNEETILWIPADDREVTKKEVVATDGGMFTDVIIYADDHPIGYMVIEIIEPKYGIYVAELLVSHCFPKIDGEYQNVTEEDIQKFIAQAKK